MSALTLQPLPASQLHPSRSLDPEFGRIAGDVDVTDPDAFAALQDAVYRHSVVVIPKTVLSPEAQYKLTQAFDPTSTSYGHGNKGRQDKSVLHPDLKTIPRQPQVQVIGNGFVSEHEGLRDIRLKHPHHKTFHETEVPEAEDQDFTRFYRWHIDSALYDLATPRVTSLYALRVPQGRTQTLRYDDGSGDELKVPLGTTAFVSGAAMFETLSPAEKSLAVRAKVRYAPHPYVWMSQARSNSVGLGLVNQGKELALDELPAWTEDRVKTLPMVWKNPVTGRLHLQVHPSAVQEILVEPLPPGAASQQSSAEALYPEGAHLTDLADVRALVWSLQRKGVSPDSVYAHDWAEGDLCLFHNQGVLHSVVGAFSADETRVFHQCNLAASCDPAGPTEEDVRRFA